MIFSLFAPRPRGEWLKASAPTPLATGPGSLIIYTACRGGLFPDLSEHGWGLWLWLALCWAGLGSLAIYYIVYTICAGRLRHHRAFQLVMIPARGSQAMLKDLRRWYSFVELCLEQVAILAEEGSSEKEASQKTNEQLAYICIYMYIYTYIYIHVFSQPTAR